MEYWLVAFFEKHDTEWWKRHLIYNNLKFYLQGHDKDYCIVLFLSIYKALLSAWAFQKHFQQSMF